MRNHTNLHNSGHEELLKIKRSPRTGASARVMFQVVCDCG